MWDYFITNEKTKTIEVFGKKVSVRV